MAKPIFVIGLPERISMKESEDFFQKVDLKNDYHIVIYYSGNEYDFKVFNDPNFTEANFEEIKNYIKQQIENK